MQNENIQALSRRTRFPVMAQSCKEQCSARPSIKISYKAESLVWSTGTFPLSQEWHDLQEDRHFMLSAGLIGTCSNLDFTVPLV